MSAFDVKPAELPRALRKLGDSMERHVIAGVRAGAVRVQRHIATVIIPNTVVGGKSRPPIGVSGLYRAGWKAVPTLRGAIVANDIAYAGVIELGRRRGKWPPRKPILLWLRRARGLSEKEAKRAVFPVSRAIKTRGIKPRRIGARSLPFARRVAGEEVNRALARVAREARP